MTSHYLFIYLFQFPFYRQKTKDYEVNLMHAFSNDIIFHSNIPPPHPTILAFSFCLFIVNPSEISQSESWRGLLFIYILSFSTFFI